METGIIGYGKYLPEKVLTNHDLEKMVDTSDEWITTRTGIKERRIAESNIASSDMGAEAAKKALSSANLESCDIELIIVATITPDMLFPSTACFVQKKLGAKNAVAYDISAACSGFIYALEIAGNLIKNKVYKNALVIGSEKLTAITDWEDRSTCILFGDGAGAVVLAPVEKSGIITTYLATDGEQADLLYIPGGGSRFPTTKETVKERLHYLKMKGNELFKYAVRTMVEACFNALEKANLKSSDIRYLIPHQANIRIISACAKRLGIDMERVWLNINRYGNMSSASTAVALCETLESGKLKKGDKLLLVAFGAGLTWAASIIEV
jgi:3-oxoacyl-[acyl-carrier-protein] synthase-3